MDNLITSNLTHHPGRTLASVIGVAVGVILVVLTVGLVRGQLRDRGQRDANIGVEIMLFQGGQGISLTSSDMTISESEVKAVLAVLEPRNRPRDGSGNDRHCQTQPSRQSRD